MPGPASFEANGEHCCVGSEPPVYTKDNQISELKQHVQNLEGMLDDIRKQIDELETK